MTYQIPKTVCMIIKEEIFNAADEFGYLECSKAESGRLLNDLVDNPQIGKRLAEYMPQSNVRTYIKDAVLNSYAKRKKKKALSTVSPEDMIKNVYGDDAMVIQTFSGKREGMYVLRNDAGNIYILSRGTVVKWETALRKALQIVVQESLTENGKIPRICLNLYNGGRPITKPDKKLVTDSLAVIGVKVTFC